MKIVINGEMVDIPAGQNGIPTVPLTQAEYDALTDDEKNAEKLYLITDAAASGSDSGGSSEEVYSTEETRIGTWIDGKPLYRKVLVGEVTNVNATYVSIYDNFLPEKNLIFAKGRVMFDGVGDVSTKVFSLFPAYPHQNVLHTGNNCMVSLSLSSIETNLFISYKTAWPFSYEISIEYTKTTDTAARRLTQ